MLQGRRAEGATGQHDVRRERDKFRRVFAIAVGIVRAPSGIDPHIAAVAPAQLLHGLLERRHEGLAFCIVRGTVYQHTDPPNRLGLLRARSERPSGGSAAQKRDEFAPPHSITSSAVASNEDGTARPSAL